MKKLLIVSDYFLPGYKAGGPVSSIANLYKLLDKYLDITIITRNHDFGDKEAYKELPNDTPVNFRGYKVIYLSNLSIPRVKKVISELNPEIIYLNSIFSIFMQKVLLLNKFFFKKKLILAPRGELQPNALNIKKWKKQPFLFLYKTLKLHKGVIFHFTSKIECKQALEVLGESINFKIISNVFFTRGFEPLSNKKRGELKIVYISRITKKKNLKFALTVLSKISDLDLTFDIYGPIEDQNYWETCRKIIADMPSNIKVSYKGTLPKDKVFSTLRRYHVFFLPTQNENFGYAIVEAMEAGLIPVISDNTPWQFPKSEKFGYSIALKNVDEFIKAFKELYFLSSDEFKSRSQRVINYLRDMFDINKLRKLYLEMFELL